jgi:hypothetical protein
MKHEISRVTVLAAVLLVMGAAILVASGSRADAAGSPDLDGMWTAVYSTTSLQNAGTCIVGIDDNAGTLTDTVPLECRNNAGVLGQYNGDLTGTRTGQSVSISTVSDYSFPPPAVVNGTISGTVSKDGLSASGNWSNELGSGTFESGKMVGTSAGTDVTHSLAYGGSITFEDVTTAGDTQAIFAPSGAGALPPNFALVNWQGDPLYFHVTTTADYVQGSGSDQGVTVCAPYTDLNNDDIIDDSGVHVFLLDVLHWTGTAWEVLQPGDPNFMLDTLNNRVCVKVEHLSPFAVVTEEPKSSFEIAFQSFRDGNAEIYRMTAGGANQVNVTNNPASDTNPAWATDGSVIGFTSDRDGNSEIYFTTPDGSYQYRLTNNSAYDDLAAYSPDNTKIAFVSDRDGNHEIYVMDSVGGNQTRLTNSAGIDTNPTWSPDGTKIAFESVRGGNRDVYVMNADGTGQVALTSDPADDGYPDWSPDGTRIAFTTNRTGDFEVFAMKSDGSSQTNISNSPGLEFDPSWKASSGELVYTNAVSGYRTFKMIDSGANQTGLTSSSDLSLAPDWSRVSGVGLDFDVDGCTDAREAQTIVAKGGRRNPQNFWDFFDTPNASNVRDKAVAATDFNRVLGRFGANDTGPGAFDRFSDPLSMPNAFVAGMHRANYHPAFDRGAASVPGQNWTLTAANGAIAATDFNAALAQFGHTC